MKTLLNIQLRHKTKKTTKILHLQHLSRHLFISAGCKFLRVVAFSCSPTSLTGFKPPKSSAFPVKAQLSFVYIIKHPCGSNVVLQIIIICF